LPGFTPGRRWQPAYTPFKRESFGNRALVKLELLVKGPMFGRRMCGNCLLQETAFICPMECPKGLRNGPCGGATEQCYVGVSPLHLVCHLRTAVSNLLSRDKKQREFIWDVIFRP